MASWKAAGLVATTTALVPLGSPSADRADRYRRCSDGRPTEPATPPHDPHWGRSSPCVSGHGSQARSDPPGYRSVREERLEEGLGVGEEAAPEPDDLDVVVVAGVGAVVVELDDGGAGVGHEQRRVGGDDEL